MQARRERLGVQHSEPLGGPGERDVEVGRAGVENALWLHEDDGVELEAFASHGASTVAPGTSGNGPER